MPQGEISEEGRLYNCWRGKEAEDSRMVEWPVEAKKESNVLCGTKSTPGATPESRIRPHAAECSAPKCQR